MVIAAAPASSMSFATSRALMCVSSMPVRIFTVTGFCTAEASVLTKCDIFFRSFRSTLPAPVRITFHAGHPQLMSIMSKSSSRIFAAATTSGRLLPKSCTATGFSSGLVTSMACVLVLPRTSAVLLTNSV